MIIHVVRAGETAAEVAALYGVSESRLIYDNELSGQGSLVEGQALLVLEPEIIHTVQTGETLQSIAMAYGTSVRQLYRNNPYLQGQPYLYAGQSLVIRYSGERIRPMKVIGYAYPFIPAALLQEVLLYMDELLVFSYGFTMEGELLPPLGELPVLEQAKEFGVDSILVLTPLGADGRFNNQLVSEVVRNPQVQARVIAGLMENVRTKGYAGVDVDFEYILSEDREGYAAFVANIREALAPEGRVSVALAPKTSADQQGLLYEGMDYRLLGESADTVFLMTYEWGYKYSMPMAIAPLPAVTRVLDYALSEIPREQILLGIPNYAYDWPLPYEQGITAAATIGPLDAVRLAAQYGAVIRWDESAKSPWFTYEAFGEEHEVWFEDVRSVLAKLELADGRGILGVGYWNVMRPFRANWLLVNGLVG